MPDCPVYWLGEDLVRIPCFVHLLEIDRNYGVEGDTETPRHSVWPPRHLTPANILPLTIFLCRKTPGLSGLYENIILEAIRLWTMNEMMSGAIFFQDWVTRLLKYRHCNFTILISYYKYCFCLNNCPISESFLSFSFHSTFLVSQLHLKLPEMHCLR